MPLCIGSSKQAFAHAPLPAESDPRPSPWWSAAWPGVSSIAVSSRLERDTARTPARLVQSCRQTSIPLRQGSHPQIITPSGAGSGCSPHSAASHRPEVRLRCSSASPEVIAMSAATCGISSRCLVSMASADTANSKWTTVSPDGSGRKRRDSVAASRRAQSGCHINSSRDASRLSREAVTLRRPGNDGSAATRGPWRAAHAMSTPSMRCASARVGGRRGRSIGRRVERSMLWRLESHKPCHPMDAFSLGEL
eukprot:scaffold54507_cov30-Tisochrysis_lutea.AAC.1